MTLSYLKATHIIENILCFESNANRIFQPNNGLWSVVQLDKLPELMQPVMFPVPELELSLDDNTKSNHQSRFAG